MRSSGVLAAALVLVAGALAAETVRRHYSFRGGYPAKWNVRPGCIRAGGMSVGPGAGQAELKKTRTLVGKVTGVQDGGTIYVTPNGGARKAVRLARIVPPAAGEAYAAEAQKLLSDLVLGKQVSVEYEPAERGEDIVGIVYQQRRQGLTDINLTMVVNGAARHDREQDSTEAYAQAEEAARTAHRGVWSDGK